MESGKEIEQELRLVSPYLASLPKRHPFLVPENYFSALERNILVRIASEQRQDILSEQVAHPFEVPEDYFNDLSSNIITMIRGEESRSGMVRPINTRRERVAIPYRKWLAAASVVILITLSVSVFWTRQGNKVNEEAATSGSVASVDASSDYLMENVPDIDEATIVNLVTQDQGQQQSAGFSNDKNQNVDEPLLDVSDIDPELLYDI